MHKIKQASIFSRRKGLSLRAGVIEGPEDSHESHDLKPSHESCDKVVLFQTVSETSLGCKSSSVIVGFS